MALAITVQRRSPRCSECRGIGHTRLHCESADKLEVLPVDFPTANHERVLYAVAFGAVVKIGTSANVRERLSHLEDRTEDAPTVLGVRIGGFAEEKILKRAVRRWALRGETEWLRDSPELRHALREWDLDRLVIPQSL